MIDTFDWDSPMNPMTRFIKRLLLVMKKIYLSWYVNPYLIARNFFIKMKVNIVSCKYICQII